MPVIVLSHHRDGSSMTAGILQKLGVNMGENLLGANEGNPYGYFEDTEFFLLNKSILNAAGGNWANPPEKEEIEYVAGTKVYRKRIKELLKNKKEPWGFKDPRNTLTFGAYVEHLDNVKVIICNRDKRDIVASFRKRDGENHLASNELVEEYDRRIKWILKSYPTLDYMELDFEETLENPKVTVENIAQFIGVEPNQEAIDSIKPPKKEKKPEKKEDIIVFTSLIGERDLLRDKQEMGKTKFVAFTNEESDAWDTYPPYEKFKDDCLNAKIHKVLAHKFLNTEVSMWIDGNIVLNHPPEKIVEEWLGDYDIVVFNHPGRDCIYSEVDACIGLGRGNEEELLKQAEKYWEEGYPKHNGLAECTMIIRKHNERTKEFNEAWWAEICSQSTRDQVSFPYIASKSRANVKFLKGKGYIENHPYFSYLSHSK